MEDKAKKWWVFDRPLWRDGLLWSGLVFGILLAVYSLSAPDFYDLSVARKVLSLVTRLVVGILVIGVIGGAARHFLRGYRNEK